MEAAAYMKNEEGEVELRDYNSSMDPTEIHPQEFLGVVDSLNQELLQMQRPWEKCDEEEVKIIGKGAVSLGTKKNQKDVLEEIEIGKVRNDIEDKLISIIQRIIKAF